jgi:DNA-directed RNA polymerase subunit RPC12/RpoP
LDKVSGNLCPRCGVKALNIYYEEEADLQLGGICESCGFRALSMGDKLIPLVTA